MTAVVRSKTPAWRRIAVAQHILKQGRAEQIGFAVQPRMGGDSRIEMMGGEFCGNAVRAYGFLTAMERFDGGVHSLLIEISGTGKPVPVTADLDRGQAFAQMPLPMGLTEVSVGSMRYPVVLCDGICHLLAINKAPDPIFVPEAVKAMEPLRQEAMGALFVTEKSLIPAVYVKNTDTLVWESSCGSGSAAWGWYLARRKADSGEKIFRFSEPGGEIITTVTVENGQVTRIMMGGDVTVLPEVEPDD